MLQKWKDIIANWINCYFNESDKREERVTLDSLLNIISHLRENLSLDESKSSILEAHTVEEFVREKYPEFRFDNGSVAASSEDDIHIVASLLLYFVCVNSKDLDIKQAMCSQLSSEDQEIILKFSKSLMECSPVTYKDVRTAICEACGQDSATIGPSSSRLVSETPPALRSLHGEVRRLQAALDAERFDRNYLQEELARTNLRVEKLAKDKEQYKLDIVNLKAKISMCCGQETDARAGDAAAEGTARLLKQLEETEERLVQTQEQLEDAQYERDAYKTKINELKQERDKWLAVSQQEAARASQLCSELDDERRHSHGLRELVAELRQHNQLNRLDTSQLECDDPDASMQSLHHNTSVCSEACANVVEVQLSEERAKIVVLKQQIQSLQDQLNDLTQTSETEKQSLERIISERENEIFNLKHRINEEIEEKNNMTIHFSDGMTKLNNEINELEQKLKDNNQQYRMVLDAKMQEIQTLQEEKLSLLQSLTDETNKLEDVIKKLRAELDSEKTSKVKMKEDYDNHIMKLNEKVLNRNNELVELQNDVFEKSDRIEALHLELRKEKQAREELVSRHHDEREQMNERLLASENIVQLKCQEISRLTERLNYNFEFIKELGREVDELKFAVSEQSENCRVLEGTKETMMEELETKDKKLEEIYKHLENMENVCSEEKDRLEKDLDEAVATVQTLRMQLHEELQYKIESNKLQEEIQNLKQQLDDAQSDYNDLMENYKMLLDEKAILMQKLVEEESTRKIVEEQKDLLSAEKTAVKENLNVELKLKNDLQKDKKRLTQQLVEEKTAKELAEKEKKNLTVQFSQVTQAKDKIIQELQQKLQEASIAKQTLQNQNEILQQNLHEEKSSRDELINEKDELINEKDELIKNKDGLINKKEELLKEKEELVKSLEQRLAGAEEEIVRINNNIILLTTENASLLVSLQDAKACNEALEQEINALLNSITELKEQNEIHSTKLKHAQDEYEDIKLQLADANSQNDKYEESNAKIKSILIKGVVNLSDNLKKENICNELLSDVITIDNTEDMNVSESCYFVLNIADALTTELVLKKNVEKELENEKTAIAEMRRLINEKETLASELEKKVNKLQQTVNENKIEYEESNAKIKSILIKGVVQLTNNLKKENICNELLSDCITTDNTEDMNVSESCYFVLNIADALITELVLKKNVEMELENEKTSIAEMRRLINEKETLASELEKKVNKLQQTVNENKIEYEESNAKIKSILIKGVVKLSDNLKNENICNELLSDIITIDNTEDMNVSESCYFVLNIADALTTELVLKKNVEKELDNEKIAIAEIRRLINEKEMLAMELEKEVNKLQQTVNENKIEMSKQKESYVTSLDTRTKDVEALQQENQSLSNELNDVKSQLEIKVHSLKERLTDNEHLTEKLKTTYDCQIDNLNVMVTQLTSYLKDKTEELEMLKKEKEQLRKALEDGSRESNMLQEEIHNLKQLLNDAHSDYNDLMENYKVLLDEKAILMQQLVEEKSTRKIVEEQKDLLSAEKNTVKENLDVELKLKNILLEDKERLTQQLVEERSAKELAEKEKENLSMQTSEDTKAKEKIIQELYTVMQENMSLRQQLQQAAIEKQDFQNENEILGQNLYEEKSARDELVNEKDELMREKAEIIKEKEELVTKVESLEQSLTQATEEMNRVNNKMILVTTEKASLLDSLQDAKASKEALQNECIGLLNSITEIKEQNEKHATNLKHAQDEYGDIKLQLADLNSQKDKYEEDNAKVKSILADGIVKLLDNLKKENINNDFLNEFKSDDDAEEMSITEKCCLVFNIANALTAELALKKNVEVALESEKMAVGELRRLINDKELQVLKLQKEINELQQTDNENKIEMSKQKESYVTSLDTRTKDIETLQQENQSLSSELNDVKLQLDVKVHSLTEKLTDNEHLTEKLKKTYDCQIDNLNVMVTQLTNYLKDKTVELEMLRKEKEKLHEAVEDSSQDINNMKKEADELKRRFDCQQTELENKIGLVAKENNDQVELNKQLKHELDDKRQINVEIQQKLESLTDNLKEMFTTNENLVQEKAFYVSKAKELQTELDTVVGSMNKEIKDIQDENTKLKCIVEENKIVITELEHKIKLETERSNELRLANDNEKLNLNNKCSLLQEYQVKAERQMEEQQKEIHTLHDEIKTLKAIAKIHEKDLEKKCDTIREKDEQINNINKDLVEMKAEKEKLQAELESKIRDVHELKQKLNSGNNEAIQKALRSEEWVKTIAQRDLFAVAGSEKAGSHKNSCNLEKDYREFQHQVDNTTSDLTHSSMESIKTISDLEKIIHDKNRTITTLQSDITYLKSLIADSENKLLDVTKELEVSKENCQQLSNQLKKIVHQKNEEIAELKKQVNKMSVTENRASQIIKVSAKYQAIILKRIAEIKSNTVLKELTNFGNTANGDNELRRSLNAGTITMEDLENFLETTDKHLKRCSEKQIALQKERDRLTEVNRINESEIINLKKFLTELSVSFKTFSSVKDLYAQKFSRVVSVQRTVRREILSLDGHITDAAMCRLERGYVAVMQDLSECVMNMERWVERCIGRTISPEKIKQAFSNDEDRASFASTTFQNAGLEVQLEELEKSFQKLLEEVVRAQKGEGARDAQSVTVMEVRAEYEDKLNRMKAKMKQLYQEQISAYKEKQRVEVIALERELAKTRERLAESSKAYEEHIRALTAELWSVGEKFLTKKDEVDWLKKKQRSGSLMSLQHVHSSGLVQPPEEPSRPSDTHSLRSLPVHNNASSNKREREGRGLHMSDEEGEVFDNRWLRELASTPRRGGGQRLSELRWRNSLCPPHLKSSYPAETQFQPVLDEEDIKFSLGNMSLNARQQRKEVGITAYKKPGPPTPSKNAGRLSATDSELRESLRVEAEPQPSRKTSTPSRLRSLFRSNKNDTAEGTPRSKRLSIFRKK